jgi:anti-sigma regulatory factor (Ser/Thr protein kinase)
MSVERVPDGQVMLAFGEEYAPALDQPFDEEGLFALRSAVAAHTADLDAATVLDDAVLVAHELSSNAVRHGGGIGRLRLWRTATALVVQVSDSGQGLPDPAQAGRKRPSPSVPGGRGLWIVRHLAAMRIDQTTDGLTVTATIALPPGEGPPASP